MPSGVRQFEESAVVIISDYIVASHQRGHITHVFHSFNIVKLNLT